VTAWGRRGIEGPRRTAPRPEKAQEDLGAHRPWQLTPPGQGKAPPRPRASSREFAAGPHGHGLGGVRGGLGGACKRTIGRGTEAAQNGEHVGTQGDAQVAPVLVRRILDDGQSVVAGKQCGRLGGLATGPAQQWAYEGHTIHLEHGRHGAEPGDAPAAQGSDQEAFRTIRRRVPQQHDGRAASTRHTGERLVPGGPGASGQVRPRGEVEALDEHGQTPPRAELDESVRLRRTLRAQAVIDVQGQGRTATRPREQACGSEDGSGVRAARPGDRHARRRRHRDPREGAAQVADQPTEDRVAAGHTAMVAATPDPARPWPSPRHRPPLARPGTVPGPSGADSRRSLTGTASTGRVC